MLIAIKGLHFQYLEPRGLPLRDLALPEPECWLPDLDLALPAPLALERGLPLRDLGLPEPDLFAGDGLLLPDPDLEATELRDGEGDPA